MCEIMKSPNRVKAGISEIAFPTQRVAPVTIHKNNWKPVVCHSR